MAQTVTVILTVAGTDTGPFNIYTDANGYTVPVATGVSKASLLAGYVVSVPDSATIIQVKSTGVCTNSYFMPIALTPPTSTTTTTTTEVPPPSTTTTSTTTQVIECIDCYRWYWLIANIPEGGTIVRYYSCSDFTLQSRAISNTDTTTPGMPEGYGAICNCDTTGNPYTESPVVPGLLTQTARCTDPGEWYQIENCFQPGQYLYTTQFDAGSFAVGDRVLEGLDVFTVVNVVTTNPGGSQLAVTPALNPVTNAQLTGCPDIVQLIVEPYYDDFSDGDKVRAEWSTPAVPGPELGFSGTVKRYLNNGCVNEFNTTYFAPGGLNAVAIDNSTYQLQTSCQNLGGSTSPLPSNSKLKITQLTIYTQATPFARDVNGCPTDFSGATTVVTATANNYSGTYRFSIYDPIAADYTYFSIIGCFTCPL